MTTNLNNGENDNWRTKTLITGAVLGALIGLGGAYLLVKSSEQEGHQVNITTGDGIRLGLLVMGLLRQVAQLGEGK